MTDEYVWNEETGAENPAPQPDTSPVEPVSAAPQSSAPHSYGKTSPYANSPFAAPEPDPRYAAPAYSAEKPPKGKKSGGFLRFLKRLLCIILICSLVGGSCYVTGRIVQQRNNTMIAELHEEIAELQAKQEENIRTPAPVTPIKTGEVMTPSQVYAQCADKVVAISCTIRSSIMGRVTEGTSTGSGFVLTDDGYVITNYHVVENASSISVITHKEEEFKATLIGKDSINDVAVLKVDAENLPAVTLGSSNNLAIGDMVVAIGNPLGTLSATQTVGYVSGKDRQVTTDNTIINMLQTDAAINPGNSGGPLFNMYGEVVGITTAKYSGTTNSGASIEGIGFAIPIDDVLSTISDLKDLGYISSGYLGVIVNNMDSKTASMYNLPNGAYVSSVSEDSAAEKAGVQPKDIIVKLGGTTVTNISDLNRALRDFKAGDETTITVVRGGQEIELTVVLDEKPQETEASQEIPADTPSEGSYEEWFDYFNRFFGQRP